MKTEKKTQEIQLKRYLRVGEEEFQLEAFRTTKSRQVLFFLLSILTFGLYRLIAHWIKSTLIFVRYEPCSHEDGEIVYIKDLHGVETIKQVHVEQLNSDGASRPLDNGEREIIHFVRYFYFRKIKYIWYENENNWFNPADMDSNVPFNTFLKKLTDNQGLDASAVKSRKAVYEHNSLEVQLTPLIKVLITEVLTPFYLFQTMSVTLWYSDNYEYYASVIVFITVVSAIIAVYQTRTQEKKVRSMVGDSLKVTLLRDGKQLELNSKEIVPGDLIVLPKHSFIVPCDGLLLNGSAIVNEAMLTGESVPVTKVPLTNADECGDGVRFSSEKHNRHTLFCGTTVLQTRYYDGKPVLALAIRTGFSTLKGQLVRSIMYPKPMDKQYMTDLFKFIFFLAFIAGIGFIYTIILMVLNDAPIVEILVKSLDVLTIVVPPALPAAMSIGILNAVIRLKKQNIFCIAPSTINTCGQINVACFDKTGTLTEDGLNFHCLRAVKNFQEKPEFTDEYTNLTVSKMIKEGANIDVVNAAATCHSLTRIDGDLHGDPLDLILFSKSNWSINEPVKMDNENELFDSVQPTVLKPPIDDLKYHSENPEYSIIRQFPFSSALQRMSVIVSTPSKGTDHDMKIYSKGSPEIIKTLCDSETIPENYSNIVDYYAQRGFRLISIASAEVSLNFAKAMKIPRKSIETHLNFLGLVVMENRLKETTLDVINELFLSNIRSVMVTGDNLLTAMSVARECGIIRPLKKAFLITHSLTEKDHRGRTVLNITESVSSSEAEIDTNSEVHTFDRSLHLHPAKYHLAIAGPTYNVVSKEYPDILNELTAVCDVYARMAPDQKSGLIVALQQIGYKVAMCGDGANDCSALKAADAGISLSEAEASIAAPFTSKVPDIRCVPKVIKEGRCAIVTSFAVFKYMAAYSLNEFLTVLILYAIKSNLSDGQFLYIDFVLITIVALFLGNTEPSEKLSIKMPPLRLASISSFCSVIGQFLINLIVQVSTVFFVNMQPWYSLNGHKEYETVTFEGTALFAVTSFMYLGFAFVYSKGAPFRKSIFTNYPLCFVILIIGIITMVLVLCNLSFVNYLMGFEALPSFEFRLVLVIISIVGGIISVIFEYFFTQGLISTLIEKKIRSHRLNRQDPSLPLFERLLTKIGESPIWMNKSISQPSVFYDNEHEPKNQI